jgi:acyl CoA:acetate/3-ketoacid CoA transferase alpha subunit
VRVFLNGQEMFFTEGGYEYIFMKPYTRHQHEVIKRERGELTIQLYDNGVQIRTLVTKDEVSTLINRDVAIDTVNNKIYILEEDSKIQKNPDGSIEIL